MAVKSVKFGIKTQSAASGKSTTISCRLGKLPRISRKVARENTLGGAVTWSCCTFSSLREREREWKQKASTKVDQPGDGRHAVHLGPLQVPRQQVNRQLGPAGTTNLAKKQSSMMPLPSSALSLVLFREILWVDPPPYLSPSLANEHHRAQLSLSQPRENLGSSMEEVAKS